MPVFDHFFSNYNYCWICWSWRSQKFTNCAELVLSENTMSPQPICVQKGGSQTWTNYSWLKAGFKHSLLVLWWHMWGNTCQLDSGESLILPFFLLSPLPQNTWTEAHTNLFPGLIYSCPMIIIQVKFWFNEQYGKCLQLITQVNFLFVNVYTDRYVKSN